MGKLFTRVISHVCVKLGYAKFPAYLVQGKHFQIGAECMGVGNSMENWRYL